MEKVIGIQLNLTIEDWKYKCPFCDCKNINKIPPIPVSMFMAICCDCRERFEVHPVYYIGMR